MRVSVVATGIEGSQSALPGMQPATRTTTTGIFGSRVAIAPAAPGVGELPPEPTPPSGGPGGGGGGGGGTYQPQASPAAGPMAAGVFGTPGATFQHAASGTFQPAASAGAPAAEDDDSGFSDEDILELGEPIAEAPASEPVDGASPVIAELPLAAPARLELPEPERRATAAEPVAPAQPERRQTLFERMMDMARKPKVEEPAPQTLAPEPEVEEESETRIPPFMRAQRNG
jgi:hypothetical protein